MLIKVANPTIITDLILNEYLVLRVLQCGLMEQHCILLLLPLMTNPYSIDLFNILALIIAVGYLSDWTQGMVSTIYKVIPSCLLIRRKPQNLRLPN